MAENNSAELAEAATAVLAFYDSFTMPHLPGEAKVLDALEAALRAQQPTDASAPSRPAGVGREFRLGDRVRVSSAHRLGAEWAGVDLYICGIIATSLTGEPSYSTSEQWPPEPGYTTDWPVDALQSSQDGASQPGNNGDRSGVSETGASAPSVSQPGATQIAQVLRSWFSAPSFAFEGATKEAAPPSPAPDSGGEG